jgi:putative ABC transport system permease protein
VIPVNYNLRNLLVRKSTTASTALGLALVVFVFASALMLSNGLEKSLTRAGREDIAIVLRTGSETELSSSLTKAQTDIVVASKEIARSQSGEAEAIGEIVVVARMQRADGHGLSNVSIRGVPDNVLKFRPEVKIIAGRAPQPGTSEVLIGSALRGRLKGLELGQTFEFKKNRPMNVVGVFSSEGSALESEIWAGVQFIGAAFGREGSVSSVRVKLLSPGRFDAFKASLSNDPRLEIEVFTETAYYERQGASTSVMLKSLGLLIAVFVSIGATIGAMITMYSTISNRQREIGTLRALGFPRGSILSAFLLESTVLALVGGLIGAIAALPMGFVQFSTVNFTTQSEITFSLQPSVSILISSMLFAGFMGVLGGLLPAVRAAWMQPIQALRD